jgi:hypothetical protein
MPDGEVVEAFQMTIDTRYQEKGWPAWMKSSYLMTIDGVEWLNINDVETEVPDLGWIVHHEGGRIEAVDYLVMEKAEKMVIEVVEQPPEQLVKDEDALVALAAKLAGVSVEEFLARQEAKAGKPDTLAPTRKLKPDNSNIAAYNEMVHDQLDAPTDLRATRLAYELMAAGDLEAAKEALGTALQERTEWCNCGPGQCDGKSERWACRTNSPLAQ